MRVSFLNSELDELCEMPGLPEHWVPHDIYRREEAKGPVFSSHYCGLVDYRRFTFFGIGSGVAMYVEVERVVA